MADIIIGIDGTGPSPDGEYAAKFKDSYVNRLCNQWPAAKRFYSRGPSLSGSQTGALSRQAAAFASQAVDCVADPRVFLTGYSRGGAAVLEACHELNRSGISVHGLILFDAVDRTNTISKTSLAPNVKFCAHAMRDPKAGSRELFGNCGPTKASGARIRVQTFYCTHGAMGGTPWEEAGKSGKIEEVDTATKVGAAAIATALGTAIGGPAGGTLGRQQVDKNDFTNVTLEQEMAGAAAVWNWISGQVAAIRAA